MAGFIKKAISAARERQGRRRLKKLAKKGKVYTQGSRTQGPDLVSSKAYDKKATKQQKSTLPGSEKTGKVSRGAVGAQRTKGGSYAKYKKDSKAAGNFRSAFKDGCSGGKKSFSWQGRSYSCKKA
tara:strand:+ start:597 stop:971 length:375 start_codon:yes stop_codon:yes gene_type:complete